MRLVMKFGGTSVGNADAVRQVAAILKKSHDQGHQVVTVVSAMRGVTDQLIDAARAAATGETEPPRAARQALWERHHAVAAELLQNPYQFVLGDIDAHLANFSNLTSAIAVLGELTPRALDFISSLGERFSALILAALLREIGLSSVAVMADRLIVTDRHFGSANPLLDLTAERAQAGLLPMLEAGALPVVTGFLGATLDGIVTTLGRGGSDYTGAILGAALNADEVWIWTDVDGVLTADPRIVPEACSLRQISYLEAAELSYFGARVLHPKTVRPAVDRGIPIRILNTFNPDHAGTLIVKEPQANGHAVKAVTAIRGLALIAVEGRGMMGVPGVAARVFETVASLGVSVLMISQGSSEQSICFVVEEEASQAVVEALEGGFRHELTIGAIDRIDRHAQVVIIAVVGWGMRGTPGISARLFGALGERSINVLSIAQGSSEANISLVVDHADAHEAIQAIHAAFELDRVANSREQIAD
ncbi:MAG: aspartate kinase [Ardenticatenaceae bacterium]|nr:aspartate kinase [Ardenticatenaceae bacterium]HBY99383.1 aspartate kinase, monofunctional class [Chloroflexota bacterium]